MVQEQQLEQLVLVQEQEQELYYELEEEEEVHLFLYDLEQVNSMTLPSSPNGCS